MNVEFLLLLLPLVYLASHYVICRVRIRNAQRRILEICHIRTETRDMKINPDFSYATLSSPSPVPGISNLHFRVEEFDGLSSSPMWIYWFLRLVAKLTKWKILFLNSVVTCSRNFPWIPNFNSSLAFKGKLKKIHLVIKKLILLHLL